MFMFAHLNIERDEKCRERERERERAKQKSRIGKDGGTQLSKLNGQSSFRLASHLSFSGSHHGDRTPNVCRPFACNAMLLQVTKKRYGGSCKSPTATTRYPNECTLG